MHSMRERIEAYAEQAGEDRGWILLIDEFDDALLGIAERGMETVAVYDYDQVIDILTKECGSEEDALDHFEFNVNQGGEGKPLFLTRPPDWDEYHRPGEPDIVDIPRNPAGVTTVEAEFDRAMRQR